MDNTSQTPESPTCPSAAKALNASGLAVGISGSGIPGSCNPAGSNSQVCLHLLTMLPRLAATGLRPAFVCVQTFFEAAASGSWLITLPQAGHAQFLRAPWFLDRTFDLLCGRGKDTRKVSSHSAAGQQALWLSSNLSDRDVCVCRRQST